MSYHVKETKERWHIWSKKFLRWSNQKRHDVVLGKLKVKEAREGNLFFVENSPASATRVAVESDVSEVLFQSDDSGKVLTRVLDFQQVKDFLDSPSKSKEKCSKDEFESFLHSFSSQYDAQSAKKLRQTEFARIDGCKEVYLDFVGGSLAPLSLLKRSYANLESTLAGNPHSVGQGALTSIEKMKAATKRYFRCDDSDDYEVVITANASTAIELVADAFPFQKRSTLVLTKDNHTSVHSIQNFAVDKGAFIRYVSVADDLLISDKSMKSFIEKANPSKNNLLAYPAQSNATGARHDLKWVSFAQSKGFRVLLDVAAYAPMNRLNLSKSSPCRPDFLSISFYKIFGYPTGIGCLLVKRSALVELMPSGFSGGSICYFVGPWSSSTKVLHYADDRRFEHGTPNYMAFDTVTYGLEYMMDEVGVDVVRERAYALARWLESKLAKLKHSNGSKLVKIYPPHNPKQKGATIMMNFFDISNIIVPFHVVNKLAAIHGFRLRSGCFCNMGVVQQATNPERRPEDCEKLTNCADFQEQVMAEGVCGALRLSFGMGSTFEDGFSFWLFAQGLLNASSSEVKATLKMLESDE